MSVGGIFQLITNDGKQDRMLMATALLNKRLLEIEQIRAANSNIRDPTPTLVDIERTHILFMNAHFKPFCAIGYEYGKVNVQSGNPDLTSSGTTGGITFSIPQFGDFFNDMVLHVMLGSVTADNADYWTNPVANPAVGAELLAYVDYPGQALLRNVRFEVNGNPLDDYDSEVLNFHEKFFVTPNKKIGWQRNVGQEIPMPGFQNVNNANGRYGRGAGVRQQVWMLDGHQTPKPTQPALDLWVPLLFWFATDPRLSIPSVSIPYGQRFISVDFAPADHLLQHLHAFDPAEDDPAVNPAPVPSIQVCELWINNIFVNPEIHDIFIKRIGFSLIRVHRRQQTRLQANQDNELLNQLKWPIETLYFGARPIVNNSASNPNLLTDWNMYCRVQHQQVDVCGLQNSYSFLASLPAANIQADQYTAAFVTFTGVAIDFADALGVAGLTVLTVDQLNAVLTTNFYPPLIGTFVNPATPTGDEIFAATPGSQCVANYINMAPTLATIRLEAHGVPLYRDIQSNFFNHYIPYTYGGHHINTPFDVGAYMLTFNLYPGSYQPSGHVNVSRAREFYFGYTSAWIDNNNQADLSIIAVAINFLLISDGSAVLRYST